MSSTEATFIDGNGQVRLEGSIGAPNASAADVLTADGAGGTSFQPSGGSVPGASIVRGPLEFAFNTPGLADGIPIYALAPGEILLDLWISVETPFDGTTPEADVGTFEGGNLGIFGNYFNVPIDLTTAGTAIPDNGSLFAAGYSGSISSAVVTAAAGGECIYWQVETTGGAPLLLVISQNAHKGGTPIDSTIGNGEVYLVTAMPVALS